MTVDQPALLTIDNTTELEPVALRTVTIDVRGVPVPQGSLRFHPLPGGKTAARYPANVYQWRGQVQQAVADAAWETQLTGPVELHLGFEMPRLLSHYRTGKFAGALRPSAPTWPTTAPDLDKLVRCICDAVTDAGLWRDDSQVAVLQAAKRYANGPPGVLITITELTP